MPGKSNQRQNQNNKPLRHRALKNRGAHIFEENHYHDYFRQIPFDRLNCFLKKCGVDLNGKRVHVASCGCGTDVYYLKKYYNARFSVSDIAKNAVNTVLATFPDVVGCVQDNERMTFEENAFDYSFAAESLHHLQQPFAGVFELLRISKEGVIISISNKLIPFQGNYIICFIKKH